MRLCIVLYRKVNVGEMTKKYCNFPESYIKRCVEEVEWKTPRGLPQYLPREIVHRKNYFDTNRPWTLQFQRNNEPNKIRPKIFVEPVRDWSFFKGDRVEIICGPDKGKQGTICQVFQERNWVIVEGLNCKLKRMGKTRSSPGFAVQIEQPLLIKREVCLIDPADLQITSVEWRYTEEGEKVRVSTRTGRIIPLPKQAFETHDYKTKESYKESSKDTVQSELIKITFSPQLETFEMSIMRSMGFTEERIPVKTYWY